jgi:hypothetical protein
MPTSWLGIEYGASRILNMDQHKNQINAYSMVYIILTSCIYTTNLFCTNKIFQYVVIYLRVYEGFVK